MSWYFNHLVKGSTPTFLEADYANKILDALNALGEITIMSGDTDSVEYSSDGVYIYYKNPSQDLNTTIEAINPNDITEKVVVTITEGRITSVETESSGYSIKSVEVCEDGSSQFYDFVIKD